MLELPSGDAPSARTAALFLVLWSRAGYLSPTYRDVFHTALELEPESLPDLAERFTRSPGHNLALH